MEILFRSLAQYHAEVLLVLCVFNVALLFGLVQTRSKVKRSNSTLRELLRDSSGESLEGLLQRHLHERSELQETVEAMEVRLQALESELRLSKRHLGLVRYDAFDDVAGAQSFALAVFDDNGNGAVLNGVVGRTDARVYCKPLVHGRSERTLSQEEQRAIREARESSPKTIVSS